MKPAPGEAFLFDRPFGPQCVFACPKTGETCTAEVTPSPGALWNNIGTKEQPTLHQSIICNRRCGWHGYVVKGKVVNAPAGLVTLIVCERCNEPEIVVFSDGRQVTLYSKGYISFESRCAQCSHVQVPLIKPPAEVFAQLEATLRR